MGNGELYRLPEVPLEEISAEELELVNQALHKPEVIYRTISGIENETGLEPARIASVLVNSGLARRTLWHREGERVFAASDFPKPRREKVAEFLRVLAREPF